MKPDYEPEGRWDEIG